jgi:phenylalanine-4-hydroxylase
VATPVRTHPRPLATLRHQKFLEGVSKLCLDPNRVPRLDDVNRFLAPLTGFKAKAVTGYVPAYIFFDCLRRREFPTTITVRDINSELAGL